jgi:hypothetical protein
MLRDLLGSGIYFGIYETTKQTLNSYYGAEKANSAGAIAVAGALCGVGAWCVVRAHAFPCYTLCNLLMLV